MKKKVKIGLLLSVAVAAALVWTTSDVEAGGRGSGPIIYVVTQDLYYDSIVTRDPLPNKGPFQLLRPGGGPAGGNLNTDYGPGDPEYVGGRWVDFFMNPDGSAHYFSCPLLRPGRDAP